MNPSDQDVLLVRFKKRLALLGSASNHAATDFATASQGTKADSAVQSVADASTSVKGIAKKSAALTSAAPGSLIDNIAGSISLTLAAITGAVYVDDAAGIKNALSSLADVLNKTNARLEDLIAKQQTAGIQT